MHVFTALCTLCWQEGFPGSGSADQPVFLCLDITRQAVLAEREGNLKGSSRTYRLLKMDHT